MKKRSMLTVICGSLLFMNLYPVNAKSFEGREKEMNKKCAVIYDKKTQQECKEYKAYLDSKSSDLSNEISSIKSQLKNVKSDINSLSEQLKKNANVIKGIDEEITSVEDSVSTIQSSIKALNVRILEKQKSIKERDKQMRERLREMQVYSGSNNFIDFLMGSDSFADLLRRSQVLNQLNSYENEQIDLLNKEKVKLNDDKEKVVVQKDLLVAQKKQLTEKKEKAKAIEDVNKTLIAKYRSQEDVLLDQQIKNQMAQVSIPKIDTSLAEGFDDDDKPNNGGNNGGGNNGGGNNGGGNNGGGSGNDNGNNGGNNGGGNNGGGSSDNFVVPIQGTWYRSAGTWAYPSGQVHRGMDFGTYAATGLRVVAPASGIVIWTSGGCDPHGGYLGNTCGVPQTTGNNLTMIARVNGTVYAFSFYHLTSSAVSSGTTVKQGQTIAYTGNSGSSTGPHCHVEMIKVGNMSLSSALNIFNNTGDLSFGVGWRSDPKACGSAPCRLRPENYFM